MLNFAKIRAASSDFDDYFERLLDAMPLVELKSLLERCSIGELRREIEAEYRLGLSHRCFHDD